MIIRIINMKRILIPVMAGMIAVSGFSQKKSDTLRVKTSAVCDMCKDRIETALAFEKGVKSATLDTADKIATIIYNPAKTSPDQLRKAISMVGYDADAIPADPKAYARLPACCKKDAPKH